RRGGWSTIRATAKHEPQRSTSHNMYLCIDTTTPAAGITLIGKTSFYAKLDPKNVSENTLKTIDELVQKAKIQLSDLEAVFIIKGPGSFTGLRVGIAIANQFAHQLKIPIIGLRTDEWWSHRTDESDFIYLQTMNKDEVYVVEKNKSDIKPIDQLSGKALWLGDLSDDHKTKLPSDFKEITDLRSPEETWQLIIQKTDISPQKTYELVEPYYSKDPSITKSKKKLSI
ncbi:tRNA (adenosine(37)-N6)-threonylcarbamoyltransferase complex dimerization subunit type 1 TsaB, partial [Patescibacteria group bacterium]|nr:tRNA (adenosine(37)-N6)-threonylcarbamoyltransferase complex dimerization subunit type 1 TsaB [Patescibacteria group bacterium]